MLEPGFEGEGDARLKLRGSLNIENAARIKEGLMRIASGGGDANLFIEEANSVDLSFLQLVAAADKTIKAKGRTLRIIGDCSGILKDAFREAGFDAGAFLFASDNK